MQLTPLPRQRDAIEAPLGPVLVVAGPGAGKTYCLIGRVQHLVEHRGFRADRICAVTFTNKAAEEIAIRLKDSLGHAAQDVTRGTLHSLCVTILREHGDAIGLPRGFGIADEEYQEMVLRGLGVHRKRIRQLLPLFGRRRLQGYELTPADETLFRRYQSELRGRNVVDFDDLIADTNRLLTGHPSLARAIGAQWDYLLVDEFQDLNPAQFSIVTQLVVPHRNLFGVGDDEQSIFSWTGADPGILRQFAHDFAIERPILLDENRRCSRQIFAAARTLVQQNPSLFDKELKTERESVFEVAAFGFDDETEEVQWLLRDLAADRESGSRSWGEYALLYRRHEIGTFLEKCFVRAGIPCRLAPRRSLQDDPVIAYVVASLRIMSTPDDDHAVEAFAHRLLPEHLFEQIRADTTARHVDFLTATRLFAQQHPKDHPDTKKAWRFVYHVENLKGMRQGHDSLAAVTADLLSQRVGKYRNTLEEHYEKLTDPVDHPGVVALAERLMRVARSGGKIWLEPNAGVEIALRGMLLQAGFAAVGYRGFGVEPAARDVVVSAETGGGLGVVLEVFKALQVMQSRDFQEIMEEYVVFDLETTDRDPSDCEIIELGAVKIRRGEIVDRFRSLIRASRPISSRAQEVHGYGDEDLRDAPRFADVWPQFRAFVGADVLVAHNGLLFDVPVLRRAAHGLDGVDDLVFYDTLPLARSLFQESARLEDLADRFGIDTGRAHHALDDAETLASVFMELSRRKIVRARKSAGVNLLDYLGLGLVLAPDDGSAPERPLVLELARPFSLGRYSDCLDFYEAERARLGTRRVPTLDDVIERLGGRRLMERIRAQPDPARRYPSAVARLETLIEASAGETLDEQMRTFLERVVLSTSQGAEIDPHRVNLLTLHSTKGLEFSRVYVVGVEDYELPGYYPTVDNRTDEIEEARRVLYVGMTRAEDRLVLTRVDRRFGNDTGGSRFLEEIGLACHRPARSPVSST